MSRKLAIIAAASLLFCIVFLGLAVLIGGDDVLHDARSLRSIKPLIDLATRKEWRWNGGDTLALDAPINIRYQQGGPPGVSVTGPADLLEHVRVGSGRIGSDTPVARSGGAKLQAVVSGVAIRKFVVNGGENLELGGIDQSDLDLHINGNGTVHGHGKAQRLSLVIAGPGRADLGGLSVGDASISIFGNGTADLSPHGKVQLFIAGNGKLGLLTRPASLRQTIIGNGSVSQGAAESPSREAAPSSPMSPGQISVPIQIPMPVPVQDNAKSGTIFVGDSKDVDIGHVEQPSLNVTVADSGSVTAEGKVDTLNVNILGSGHANLGKIAARKVSVSIMGSGIAFVAPGDELKVVIAGSGDVHLLTRPAKIERSIIGSGKVVEGH